MTTPQNNAGSSRANMKCILLTGCAGFIGSNFVNYFLKKHPGITIVNLDIVDYCANERNVEDRDNSSYVFVKGDIGNTDLVTFLFREFQFDGVVNFAANSHVDNSFGNSMVFTKNNVIGTHNLLEVVRLYHQGLIPPRVAASPPGSGKLEVFFHISTDEVYGEVLDDIRRDEEAILLPTNPYSATKAAAEFLVHSYRKSFDMPIIVTRGNNVYGKYQFPEKVIPRFVWQLANDVPVTLHGSGASRRAFIHVDDVVRAVDTVLWKGAIGEIYNIGTHDEFTVSAVARRLVRLMKGPGGHAPDTATIAKFPDDVAAAEAAVGVPTDETNDTIGVEGDRHADSALDKALYAAWISTVEDRAFNDFRYHIDISKLEDLGWTQEVSFDADEGLRGVVAWYAKVAFPGGHWDVEQIPL